MPVIKEKAIIISLTNGEQLVDRNETLSDKDAIIQEILDQMPYCELLEATLITHKPIMQMDVTDTSYEDNLMPDDSQYKDDGPWQTYGQKKMF